MLLGGGEPVQRESCGNAEAWSEGAVVPGDALMTEISGQAGDRSFRSVVAGRLFGARWPLAALAACLFAAWRFGGLYAAFAAIVFAVVFATAALAPRRAIGEIELIVEDEGGKRRLEGISVADLAAAVPDAIIIFDGEGATLHANDAAVAAFGPFTPGLPLQRRFRAPEMQQLIERPAVRRGGKRRRRLCRARADRAGLSRHRDPHPGGWRAVRAGLQGSERGAPHRPHARRFHRQRQPRTAHAAGLDRRLRRDAAGPGPQRRGGAREFPEDHAGTDRPHGAADRRPAVAVAAGDEAVPAGRESRSISARRSRA